MRCSPIGECACTTLRNLLGEALATAEGRAFAVERICTDERFGPALARDLRGLFADTDPAGLAELFIGGVVASDLRPLGWSGLVWSTQDVDDFVLPPVPNTLFQRDNTAWIGHGATVNPMAMPARRRESLHTRTVYRHHPLFAAAEFIDHYGDDDLDHAPATLEGGDIHVLSHDTVMVGMGERTTPMGVEMLARSLFASHSVRRVLAVELPKARSAMHLDTMLTMVDVATFVAYPYLPEDRRGCGCSRPARIPTVPMSPREPASGPRWPRFSNATTCACCEPPRTCAPQSVSSGTTPTTIWPSHPASSSATSATRTPTGSSRITGSRSCRSSGTSSGEAAAAPAA